MENRMDDCAALERRLHTAQKVLDALEEQAACHTKSSMPAPLKIDLEDKRQEVANLKEQLSEARQIDQNGINRQLPRRSQVPDEYYVERDEAKKLLERFEIALQQTQGQPLLFNIYGIGGVGKTTLKNRLQEAQVGKVDFLEICFAKTAGVETPLKLMRKLHQLTCQLSNGEANVDSFKECEQKFENTLYELSHKSLNGEATSSEEERKITSWFERNIWFGSASFTSTLNKQKSYGALDAGFEALTTISEDVESLQDWIQQRVRNHPVTKDHSELQALMLEPISKLTHAFAQSLIEISQRRKRPLVLVLDTYEKAQSYLNQWLWQYLVEDTPLDSAPVRLVVVGRRSLLADEGWRKLNQDRKLLYEMQLQKFSKRDTDRYLQKIGIENGGVRNKIYKATQGLPYYLDWVRKQREEGVELDFSKGNQAIADLLLQGTVPQQRKILQVVACCRSFDLAIIRYLLENNFSDLRNCIDNVEGCFEWLKHSDFVEFTKGHYRLDDVARDVFRQSYFQEDQSQFRKTHALLADYFKKKADEIVDPQKLLPEPYEDEEWRKLIAEFLYHGLFGKGKDGLREYIEKVFAGAYLKEPDIFIAPFAFIRAEMKEENQHYLLSNATNKFFNGSEIALGFAWFLLDQSPKSYKLDFKDENNLSEAAINNRLEKIERSLKNLLEYVDDLEDSFSKSVGLIFKFFRCSNSRESVDLLLQAKRQTELLFTACRPKLLHNLFSQLGYFLENLNYYEDSLNCCQKALELHQADAFTFVSQGIALGKLERYIEALESFQKAIDLNPKELFSWANKGSALVALERFEEALESSQKAIDLNPKEPFAWLIKGSALVALERFEEALESLQKVIDLNPKELLAFKLQGEIYHNIQRFEEAVLVLDKAIKIDANNLDCLNLQALAFSFLNDFDNAILHINKVVNLNSQDIIYLANRGIILARAGRYAEALADCEQAIQQKPDDESGYYAKACCYALQGKVEQALENLQKAIDIAAHRSRFAARHNPDFDGIRNDERFQALVYPQPQH